MSDYKDILRPQLKIDEDVRKFPYRDTKGKLTIGVGRNLDDVGLRQNEIDFLLEGDIKEAEKTARALIPNFEQLNDVRRAVVVNMAFNMGYKKLATFRNTLPAINEGRYDDAADGMEDSLWFRQVGDRAKRLVKQMREG